MSDPQQRSAPLAGRQNQTFVKRQKEQKRLERASAKRAARQAKRADKAAGIKQPELSEEIGLPGDEDSAPEDPTTA